MNGSNQEHKKKQPTDLGRMVLDDLRSTKINRDYGKELKDLFRFYLDDENRAKLARMQSVETTPVKRFFRRVFLAFWIVGQLFWNLLLKLAPARRILLLISLGLAIVGWVDIRLADIRPFTTDLRVWGFAILFLILMLELKDKLLAKDEIEIARQVQIALLPDENPDLPGWSVWSYSRPANDVGGDLVDYIEMDGFRHGIALGDVSGKGLGAALLSAKLQATLRALVPEAASLEDLGTRVNTIFYRDGLANRFATLFYLELEYNSGQMRYLNAGHNPAFVMHHDKVEMLGASSFPLGMLPKTNYEECGVVLESGEMLLAYSDGLTEATNDRGEEFGEERVKTLLTQLKDLPPKSIGTGLLEEVDKFLGDTRAQDDLSLVVVVRS